MVSVQIFDFQKSVKAIRYNIVKYVIWWLFYGLQYGEKMADLSQTVFTWSTNEVYTQAGTNIYIMTISLDENMHWILPKN